MGKMRGLHLGLFGLLGLLACTQGPGRDPVLRDTGVVIDSGVFDLGFYDSGVDRDTGPSDVPVGVNDSGVPIQYPFTGVFGIIGSPDLLYAREVNGRIHLLVARFPYTYEGTISESGEVDAVSTELTLGGCLVARIRGSYDRVNAIYDLVHETCNENNGALSSRMQGGFDANFDPDRSGVYRLDARVVADFSNCYPQPSPSIRVLWALSFFGNGQAVMWAVDDLFETRPAAFGIRTSRDAFTVTQRISTSGASPSYASTGTFTQIGATEPEVVIRRDIQHPEVGCAFSIEATGVRIDSP